VPVLISRILASKLLDLFLSIDTEASNMTISIAIRMPPSRDVAHDFQTVCRVYLTSYHHYCLLLQRS